MKLAKISLTKFGLTALAAFMISACGSSGSGSNDAQQPQNNVPNNPQTTPPANNNPQTTPPTDNNPQTTPPANNPPSQAQNKTGETIVLALRYVPRFVTINGYSPTTINVEDTDVTIWREGFPNDTWTNTSLEGNLIKVCCGKYSDVRFGYTEKGSKGYVFYNGNPTPNMPTSGKATYSGEAILRSFDLYGFDPNKFYEGSSQFNVDFGDKTLKGTLEIANDASQPIKVKTEINAQISGNTFTGTTDSDVLPNGQVSGKFYGNNAKEMAGAALGEGWNAAFGAIKQ